MELQVRGQVFRRVPDGTRYVGQFTEHVSGYAIEQRHGGWSAALVERNPFQGKTVFVPLGIHAATPIEALERAFGEAQAIEELYAKVTDERKHRPPSRYDGLSPYDAHVEAQYDILVRQDRLRPGFVGGSNS